MHLSKSGIKQQTDCSGNAEDTVMVLIFPVAVSFMLVFLLVLAGIQAVNLLFPGQSSEPKK